MKLSEIPGLLDWIKTLPQQWLDDPESWTMENFYFIRPDGARAGEAGLVRQALRERLAKNPSKEGLAAIVTSVAKLSGAAALVQACEGWIMKCTNTSQPPSKEEVMEAYGPGEEAEKARKRLGIERVHALTIMAQTDEETMMMSVRAYEHPKALGEVLQEANTTKESEGTFANLLK